jgi:hypothetical protein
MKVHFDSESLEVSDTKNVTAIISLDISEGIFFPEEKWNDFVVVILDAWLSSLRKLQQINGGFEDFYFMDGPFFFRITVVGPQFIAEYFENRKVVKRKEFDLNNFIESVLKNSMELAEEVKKREWMNTDIERLIKNTDFK